MNLIRQFAEHRLAPNLLMIIMLLAGLWAVRVMPTQLDPPNDFPLVFVEIPWRGASAEDVESLLTKPIEQQLRTIPDLQELTSRSQAGFMAINVQFKFGTDLSAALDEVKQRVANIRNLPPDIEPPVVRRLLDIEPIASVIITGSGEVDELIPLIRDYERDLYSRGVELVDYSGLPKMEIALQVGSRELQQMGLSLNDLARQVAAVSADVPAGTVGIGQGAHTLRSLDQVRDAEGFESLAIESGNGVFHLGDIANIEKRPERGQPIVLSNGKPAIEMVLFRRTETDALLGNRIVDTWLADVAPTLPQGVTVKKSIDVWKLLGAQLQMIWTNGWTGLVLVLLVLYVFLNTRVALWVAAGIPVALLLGLAGFHLIFGYGISIVALLGLIMALGIVVDDAIVVAEDVVTRYEAGATALDAATMGSQRMWAPVMSSSLTTLAAFLPLLIIGGVMGDMILALPTILLCVITASLIECFLVLPGHLRGSLGKPSRWDSVQWRLRFNEAFIRFRDGPLLTGVRYSLAHPGTSLGLSLAGTALAVVLMASHHVPFNLVMGFDFEAIEANVQFASGATANDRQGFIRHLETTLEQTNKETGLVNIEGSTTRLNLANFASENMVGEQYASLNANYAFEEDRTVSPAEFIKRWREKVTQPTFVEQMTVDIDGGKNGGQADVTLVLRGRDLASVKAGAQELKSAMAAYPGVANVVDDVPFGKEQIVFELTPRARDLGLTTSEVGAQLRAAYSGARVQIFNENETEVEVRFVLPNAEQDDLSQLQQFPIKTPANTLVPLGNIAELYNRRGIDVIRHTDAQMAVRISADVDSDVANAMTLIESLKTRDLPKILEAHNLTFGLGGKSEQDAVILNTMALGGVLTLVLIYLILAWTFSSWLWPLAIMMAIPFGFTGAVIGHWVTGWDVGAMSLLGFFALTGIVVNDSIVLISVFKEDREQGIPIPDALEHAITSRFRAVMLTSLTTVAGLASLMFVTSTLAFMVAPIAVTLCFGLSFATALVLFVIPALIVLLERFNDWWKTRRASSTDLIEIKGEIA